MKILSIILVFITLLPGLSKAQNALTSDDLFAAARQASYEEKDDNKAKLLAKKALSISPQYTEIEVFLGRLYAWNKQYDSAEYHFKSVISNYPENEDACIAYIDLKYWNDKYDEALLVCNQALTFNPNSAPLMVRKAKIFKAQKQYKEAANVVRVIINSIGRNSEVLALNAAINEALATNKLTLNYDYSGFDKQFDKPWHLASIGYSRSTKIGAVSANINYANRFGKNDFQFETEAYPGINNTFYSYVSFGYAPSATIFPKYRAGVSIYANLPKSFEAEAGLRYLNFGSSTFVYTLYLGKYYSNFLFGLRAYLTPSAGGASQSYSASAKYYIKGVDDYVGFSIGSGISPDDRSNTLQYSSKNKFSSRQCALSLNKTFSMRNIFSVKIGWLNQEYKTDVRGNQFNLSAGYQLRF